MQNAKVKIPVYLTPIPVVVCCVLRFLQLTRLTDADTGLLLKSDYRTVIIYALAAAVIAVYLFFAVCGGEEKYIDFDSGGLKKAPCVLLSAAFFADFIHQGYNCYVSVSGDVIVDRVYIIQLVATGIFALLSCFYFFTCFLTVKGSGYDFRNFTFLHLVPALWGLTRLSLIMLEILDVALGVEAVLEFLLLCFLIMFFVEFALTVDSDGAAPRMLGFSARSCAALAAIVALPRLAALPGSGRDIPSVDFTCVTYLAAGIFALSLLRSDKKTK